MVTVTAPHQGAFIATLGRIELERFLGGVAAELQSGCPPGPNQSTAKCFLGLILPWINDDLGHWAESQVSGPGLVDLKPVQLVPNPFLTQLNAQSESFVRVGIQSYTPKRWSWIRLLADNGANPDASNGGRRLARWASRAYTIHQVCFFFAIAFGHGGAAQYCHLVYTSMDFVDSEWNFVTSGSDPRTDGLVQGSSQVYPSATFNYAISGGDSHAGAPKSDLTRIRLQQALDVWFNLPRR